MTKIQGEGDYVSGQKFQEEQRSFAENGDVEGAAHEAAEALDGPEAEELEAARRASAKGLPRHVKDQRRAAQHDHKVDERLEQTFPASDPAPISPGSD